jgi:hypothetical protein
MMESQTDHDVYCSVFTVYAYFVTAATFPSSTSGSRFLAVTMSYCMVMGRASPRHLLWGGPPDNGFENS